MGPQKRQSGVFVQFGGPFLVNTIRIPLLEGLLGLTREELSSGG